MLIIADSSALVALATCHALDILIALYDTVKVPQAVYNEVTISNKPQAVTLKKFLTEKIVEVELTQFVLATGGLGQGEIEAMALYKKLGADYLLIDDRRARIVAEANQIHCTGTLGVLLLAKHHNLINQVSPFIETLRSSSIYYSESLLNKTLQLAGESE